MSYLGIPIVPPLGRVPVQDEINSLDVAEALHFL
jgi:hypothetical protein